MSLKNTIRDYIIEQHHDYGGRLTAKDIISFLEVEKIHYTQRNVQGILQKLVEEDNSILSDLCSNLDSEHDGRYNESCYYCSGELKEEPAEIKDPIIAFTMAMLHSHLRSLLPSAFDEYFAEAYSRLQRHADYRNWTKKVISLPFPYERPPVPSSQENSVDIIYKSLLKGKQFKADYLGSAHDYTVHGKWQSKKNINNNELIAQNKIYHPLGLILRGQIIYLVAKVFSDTDASRPSPDGHFAIHQFINVEATNSNIDDSNDNSYSRFNFTNYITSNMIDEPITQNDGNHRDINRASKIHIELYASEAVAEYFEEDSPYKLKEEKTNWYEKKYPDRTRPRWRCFSADNVPDTEQLRRWILSLQPDVEVLEPKNLRKHFKNVTEKSSAIHGYELNWNEENNSWF